MVKRDEFGYPLDDVTSEGFHGPVALSVSTPADVRVRHAHAYTAYQERFTIAYMTKVRARRRGNPA